MVARGVPTRHTADDGTEGHRARPYTAVEHTRADETRGLWANLTEPSQAAFPRAADETRGLWAKPHQAAAGGFPRAAHNPCRTPRRGIGHRHTAMDGGVSAPFRPPFSRRRRPLPPPSIPATPHPHLVRRPLAPPSPAAPSGPLRRRRPHRRPPTRGRHRAPERRPTPPDEPGTLRRSDRFVDRQRPSW